MKNNLKCTIIVSVYKDTESLDLILESLSNQTTLPNEVIVSEDGDCLEMVEYVNLAKQKYPNLDIVHLFQEDLGWRKNRALNRAIAASKYEYLIFIDGDCVPYSTFVDGHLSNVQEGVVLCAKRIELGKQFSKLVRSKQVKVFDIERTFLKKIFFLLRDGARHPEDGFYFKPGTTISKLINSRRVRHILGCNFSCYKKDFLAINGFDETFVLPCEGEDVDPTWRFRSVGIELKNCRANANVAHLYHKKRFGEDEGAVNRSIMQTNKEKNIFYCKNGINK